jgi:hypothetical protein
MNEPHKCMSAATEQPRGMEPILNSLMQATLDVTTTSRPALRKRFEEILRGQVRDPAQAPLSEAERHAIAHARYQVEHASPDNPDCHFDYELVLNLLHVIERSAQPPAAPVDTSARSDGKTIGEFYGDPGARCSAANGDALSIAETDREVMRQAIVEACDLLAERKYGNPARSPGHNARLVLERALSTGIPALPQEALRYAATKAVEAYRRAQSEGEVVIAMENLERALSPDEPRRSVTRPKCGGLDGTA